MNNKDALFLAVPFIGFVLAVLFYLPSITIWDEVFFFKTIEEVGANYFPTVEKIKYLRSPMGPVFFIIWGIIGKITGFSIVVMRLIHLIFGYLLVLLLYKLLKRKTTSALFLMILFIANPYFILLVGPLLYTDVTGMLFVFGGIYFYLCKGNRLLAGVLLGLAICTRQLLIFVPLALGLTDLILVIKRKMPLSKLAFDIIPILMFLPLFILWDFNVNSGAFIGRQYQENTLNAFQFSWKTFNYSIILCGIYAMLAVIATKKIFNPKKYIVFALTASPLLLLGFPVNVNSAMVLGNLPDTAGLLDRIFVFLGPVAYGVIPLLFLMSIALFIHFFNSPNTKETIFLKLSIVLFVLLESYYSYCWDKHFMVIMPLIFLWVINFRKTEVSSV